MWLVAAACCCLPHESSAQLGQLTLLQVGDSVRLRLPGALRVDASMQGLRGDTLLLRVVGIESVWPVSGSDLLILERYAVRTPRQAFRQGTVVGMIAGVFVGAGAGVLLHATGVIGDPDGPPAEIVTDAFHWMGLGIAFGAIGGGVWAARHPGRGWSPIALPSR